ncbi:tRNA synthetases class I-domain-containing protein [Blastocladiella britannica]|nr:tRNA synthetases class I-domain-containing protein [Blastocladiella britannica]
MLATVTNRTRAGQRPLALVAILRRYNVLAPFRRALSRAMPTPAAAAVDFQYNAAAVETAWQSHWANAPPRDASASNQSQDFVMILPPPNVTGNLHCGHALTVAIQDSLVRWHALHGRSVRWIPGTDHAGIATQSVVERQLAKQGKPSRHDLGRDAFLQHVWDWKNQHCGHISSQLTSLGASLSWPDEYFTLDDARSRVVRDAFVALHQRGLVYRATRMVHWCPTLATAISDMEVDYRTLDGPTEITVPVGSSKTTITAGVMHTFDYPLADDSGRCISVATTRIETMLGDTAVAVHPADARYAHLVGQTLLHPLIPGRRIPIIADEYVDPELGTGAVKITPAHDPDDHAMGQRHALPSIDLLDVNGRLLSSCGVPDLVGAVRWTARAHVIAALTAQGLYRGTQPHAMRLGFCSRSGDIVEPRFVPQWFVRAQPLADLVRTRLDRGEVVVKGTHGDSEGHERELRIWLDGMHDWCVSRQLWWGHRIPAYKKVDSESSQTDADSWVVAAASPGKEWIQDEDVLDTWFSSALLPLSATNPNVDLAHPRDLVNYPTSMIETGSDILFFWVARMLMLCTALTDQVPFKTVLLHGMVRDAQGRKMSKSLGNVIDPLHVIHGRSLEDMLSDLATGNLPAQEVDRSAALLKKQFPNGLPACGADALRLTLLEHSSSRQINLDVTKVVTNHHFANKLTNVAKFMSMHISPSTLPADAPPEPNTDAAASTSIADTWLLARLSAALRDWSAGYAAGTPGRSVQVSMAFLLDDVSDKYIEYVKRLPPGPLTWQPATAATALHAALVMLYPAMPHITSELALRFLADGDMDRAAQLMSVAQLPQPQQQGGSQDTVAVVNTFDELWAVVAALRKAPRAAFLPGKPWTLECAHDGTRVALQQVAGTIVQLSRLPKGTVLQVVSQLPSDVDAGTKVVIQTGLVVHMPPLDPGKDGKQGGANRAAVEKQVQRLLGDIERLEQMAADPSYEVSVPPAVRERNERKLATFRARLRALQEQ